MLGPALLCIIQGANVENILFEYNNGANTHRIFNQTQAFLHLKKNCY